MDNIGDDVSYDPDSGLFYRIRSRRTDCVGKVIGTKDSHGYIQFGACGKKVLAHRVAFFLMTGAWPVAQVDHINGNKSDNRWSNLRSADMSGNCSYRESQKTSLPRGVVKSGSKYMALIKNRLTGRKTTYLGTYDNIVSAISAFQCVSRIHYGSFLWSDRT